MPVTAPSIITPDTTTLLSTNALSFRAGPSQTNAPTSTTLPLTTSAVPVQSTITVTATANPNLSAPVTVAVAALPVAIAAGERFYFGRILVETTAAAAAAAVAITVKSVGRVGLEYGLIAGDTGTYITVACTALANIINGFQVYNFGGAIVKIARDHAAGATSLNLLKVTGTLAAGTYTYSLYVEATGIVSKIDLGSLQQAITANVLNFQSGIQSNVGVGRSFGTIKASITGSDSDPTVSYLRNKSEQNTTALRSVGLIIQTPDTAFYVVYGECTLATPDTSSASGVFALDFEFSIRSLRPFVYADA
jgi:hypothetical protein